MKSALKNFHNFWFCAIFLVVGCMLPATLKAQLFGSSGSSKSSQNTFSPSMQQGASKAQVQKPVQFKPVADEKVQIDDYVKPVIEIYMDDFRIVPTFSKMIHCSVTFRVRSTLQAPISNISFRLKWPNLETPVSFDGVPARGTSAQNYALLGNGCYEMDTPPTVIVNRCRVKGLTQEACTGLIKWVK